MGGMGGKDLQASSLIRRIGRAGGAIRRPFFVGGLRFQHVLGFVELRRLLAVGAAGSSFGMPVLKSSDSRISFFTGS